MKLNNLLRMITLPIHPEHDPKNEQPGIGSTGFAIHHDSQVIADGIQTVEMAEYICHAANVLPELMTAAKNLEQNWNANLTEPMARLHEALVLADDVPSISKPNRPKAFHRANITPEQAQAVRHFIETWNLSMPYHDIGSALNCGECNALHRMLLAFIANEAARALMEAHVEGDDEGDDPEHFRLKTTLEMN